MYVKTRTALMKAGIHEPIGHFCQTHGSGKSVNPGVKVLTAMTGLQRVNAPPTQNICLNFVKRVAVFAD